MRKIIISTDHTANIEILDASDTDFDQYCEDLSKLFQESNIAILKTSGSTTIIRPSKLVGIEVIELKDPPAPPAPPSKRKIKEDISFKKKKPTGPPNEVIKEGGILMKKENKIIKEDIITDVGK